MLGGISNSSMQLLSPLPNHHLYYAPVTVPYLLSSGPQPLLPFSPLPYQPLLPGVNPPSQMLLNSVPAFGSFAAPACAPAWERERMASSGRKTQGWESGKDRKVERVEKKKCMCCN
eukprot:TRINITY_DN1239_c0_g2_i1.p3 TRINITY_DN1239_c0_g2~~TRINITY_DN1239_c0_g2_i1.p3  ORF type:complete len:116 (+),score=10.83 TRINITY_DN1239_c0_g2_i1:1253-1600(+)